MPNILDNCVQDFGCDFDDSSFLISSKNVSKNFQKIPDDASEYSGHSNSSEDGNNFDMVDESGQNN